MRQLTDTQKGRILAEMNLRAYEVFNDQVKAGAYRHSLIRSFMGGRYDGDQQVLAWQPEDEPPEELWAPASPTEAKASGIAAGFEEDAGAFPADLELVRYQLLSWARYNYHTSDATWRNVVAVYLTTGGIT